MCRPLAVRLLTVAVLIGGSLGLQGCLAAAAAGAVVGTAGAVAEIGVKTTGAVVKGGVDVVTTSDEEREKKERRRAKREPRG